MVYTSDADAPFAGTSSFSFGWFEIDSFDKEFVEI